MLEKLVPGEWELLEVRGTSCTSGSVRVGLQCDTLGRIRLNVRGFSKTGSFLIT